MTAFSASELETLGALSRTFVPAADPARIATLAAEGLTRAADPAQIRQLRLVLRLLEQPLANLATGAGFARFRDLDQPARERLLLRWAGSPLVLRRSAVNAFRKLLTFIAYADPGPPDAPNPVRASIGYDPDRPPVTPNLTPVRAIEVERSPAADGAASMRLEADVVIVGSGAGGGVVAAELAAAGRRVVVVEAGPCLDEASLPQNELDAHDRLYLNHGLSTTWDGSVTMLAGSGAGGGTLVNFMTCLDIPPDIRAEWAIEHGLDGLDGDEWALDEAAIEREISVAPSAVIPPKDELIRRGATALGWESDVIRRNAVSCGDCGSCPFGCPRGAKQSGIRAHLAGAVGAGASLLDRAHVRRLLRDPDGRLAGVTGVLAPDFHQAAAGSQGRPFEIRARQVVVAAGALRSPAILQASGVRHPSIGRYLRIHPVPVVGALLDEPVDMWRGTMQAMRSEQFAQDEPGRRRYVIESAPGHPGLLALVLPWQGAAEYAGRMARARYFAPLLGVVRDGGEGTTRLTRAGNVRVDYRLDDLGRAAFRHCLVSMARIARAGGAREIVAIGYPPMWHRVDGGGDEGRRFTAFETAVASFDLAPHRGSVFSAHQLGTVRMGADPATHAADPRGRIRADSRGRVIPGLYVADGSTFPTGLGVNPMLGIMTMARRVSRTVLAEGRPG